MLRKLLLQDAQELQLLVGFSIRVWLPAEDLCLVVREGLWDTCELLRASTLTCKPNQLG